MKLRTALVSQLTLTSLLLASNAFAVSKTVKLDVLGEHHRGVSKLGLKALSKRQHGRQAVKGWNLKEVEVTAKSKKGGADAYIQVGHDLSSPQNILGTPETFESYNSGFYKLNFKAPSLYRGQTQTGPWKLHLQGNVKLGSLILKLNKKLQYNYENVSNLSFSQVAKFKADKVVGTTKTIRVNGQFIKGITLAGEKSNTTINKVVINFTNGDKVIVDELQGKLRKGNTKSLRLRGVLAKSVRNIKVTATSRSLFGSRGKVKVSLAK